MNSSIKASLPENCVHELDSYLNELAMEKLDILLEQLMECIIFSLNCGEGDIVSFQYRYIHVNIKVCVSEKSCPVIKLQVQIHCLALHVFMDVSFLAKCISNIWLFWSQFKIISKDTFDIPKDNLTSVQNNLHRIVCRNLNILICSFCFSVSD